ncbi:hypothetical protein KRR38_11600 [Novosphingobium sp. G106]|nr:hypothetical protein [Novosphingobium sp. G106]
MAFHPSWQRAALANGHTPHREGEDALEFLADLADRIASACIESQCANASAPQAVPLGNDGTQSDYCQIPPIPPEPPLSEGSGVELLTPDGHMRPLDHIQADIIRLAIDHYRGRISEVARRLRMGRSTLYRKLEEYGIEYKQ